MSLFFYLLVKLYSSVQDVFDLENCRFILSAYFSVTQVKLKN